MKACISLPPVVPGHCGQKQEHLYGEPDQVGDDETQWEDQPGEIDLTENIGIVLKDSGGLGNAIGEIVPGSYSSQVKQRRGQAIGRDIGQAAEDKGVHDRREQWLDKEPERAQDGLLIERNKIPADKKPQQIPVLPDVFKIELEKRILGLKYKIPVLGTFVCRFVHK
jgi:hypothetical protein